jgi:hypothetical protein
MKPAPRPFAIPEELAPSITAGYDLQAGQNSLSSYFFFQTGLHIYLHMKLGDRSLEIDTLVLPVSRFPNGLECAGADLKVKRRISCGPAEPARVIDSSCSGLQ